MTKDCRMSRRDEGERRGVSPTWFSWRASRRKPDVGAPGQRLPRRAYASTLVFIAFFVCVTVCRADQPHLDFVRGLQARGMADLAADYLQRLSANPPANLRAILPLELARARLEQ